jgi:hypothetical protein
MTAAEKLLQRMRRKAPGWVFTPREFRDLGTPQTVGMTLLRLARAGVVRRLARGLYDIPQQHPALGTLAPDPEAIARAVAGRDGIRLQPTGAYAANLLGLSEQVPAKIVFLTDGAPRAVRVGTQTITLRKRAPSRMRTHDRLSGLLIHAFQYLGQPHVTPERIAHLRRTLPPTERRKLLKDLPLAPGWMHPIFREIARDT